MEIAHKHNADMFISVHADAAPRITASGASVYALSEGGATSATARQFMAQRENGADLLGATSLLNLKDKDPMLAGVILDMSMNATIASSLQLGSSILGSPGRHHLLHQKRVEQAGFAVLKSPDVPSILVETGFYLQCAGQCAAGHGAASTGGGGRFVPPRPAALFPEEPAGEQLHGLGPGTETQPGLTAGHTAAGERGAGATGAGNRLIVVQPTRRV